jgi:aldose 1-epimerase
MILKSNFGITPEGIEVNLYKISNSQGAELSVINLGGIIQSLRVPDKHGVLNNVVLGYDTLSEYLHDSYYMGAIVGRYGNRIAGGKFSIDGKSYALYQNDRGNHLHGGLKGFHRVIWNIQAISDQAVKLFYKSAGGEEGYPGELLVEVTYTLTDQNEIEIYYHATTDKATVVNLVQHSYFNLSGGAGDILDHELSISANTFLPVGHTMIPIGLVKSVENTPFDFTRPTPIGSRLGNPDQQLQYGSGYDHCWVVNHSKTGMIKVATLAEKISGRCMEVFTDMPGLHVYSGNFLGGKFKKHAGICLESQYFPDSPNQLHFFSPILRPGETYKSATIFKFSVR